MNVPDPHAEAGLAVLLDVQDHETHLDQLRHRRAKLPERGEITRLENEIAGLNSELAGVAAVLDDLGRQQRRLEDDAAAVEAKASGVNATLYGGTVTSPASSRICSPSWTPFGTASPNWRTRCSS